MRPHQAPQPVTLDVAKAKAATLTPRQTRILALMCGGLSNAQIGAELHLAAMTVKGIARDVFSQLGASNRTHAVALAFAAGLVHPAAREQA